MDSAKKKEILGCFIDSNVVIDYLFFRKSLNALKKDVEKENFLSLRRKDNFKAYKSYSFMKSLGEKGSTKYNFYISDYVLAEVLLSLINAYAVKLMNKRHIHISYWNKEKHSIIKNLPEEEYIEATEDFETFKEVFINSGIIGVHNNLELDRVPSLLFYGFHLQDAFLFCQAEDANCKYFLTKDQDLIDSLKKRVGLDAKTIPLSIVNFKF